MDILEQVDGKLTILGILGDPISQVKAPLMMNAELKRLQIADTLMLPFHVSSQGLKQLVIGLKSLQNFRGAIVTMPHKKAILPLLDQLSDQAKAIGACNVIRKEADGRLSGTMLDGEGLIRSLISNGHPVLNKSVYLAGAGGAACAIAHALAAHGVSKLTIYNRSRNKAEALRLALQNQYAGITVGIGSNEPVHHDIAINATSVGMGSDESVPFSVEKLQNSALVCDIVIFPERTKLLQDAERKGHPTHYGRAMLQHQISLMREYMLNQ